ncbi:hypothetical protein [Brumimicrobium oceani]|uniref:Uncharacterized protein n=1 Tax=Brumimicrobium oceani TaxID=2100725 RepID=A0A2U2XHC4_9FLAO|nr:hypothetical protein [Brumimicrobium oceani]PWH87140.1 hypothetical protein DIT68_02440 [Brumimicrobium oceani]
MSRTLIVITIFIHSFIIFGQNNYDLFGPDETDEFRGTFYSNFFGANIQSVSTSLNTYYATRKYEGKKLNKPVRYYLHGELSNELCGVKFKYELIETEEPKNLKLVKKYHLHVLNFSEYEDYFQIDSFNYYMKVDSIEAFEDLVNLDIQISSKDKENEIGIYFHSKSGDYYIKSERYCVRVKTKVKFRLKGKGKLFLRRYNYDIDKSELCKELLEYINFVDEPYDIDYGNVTAPDVNRYDLYELE